MKSTLLMLALAAMVALVSPSCQQTLSVIEAPAPPPPGAATDAALPPPVSSPPGRSVGTLPAMPPPRYAVAVFALPAGATSGDAAPSPEWTARLLNRLDTNRVPASALAVTGPLADLNAGTLALATSEAARTSDILIAGTLAPGAVAQIRLLLRDTRDGRQIGRAEFEGLVDPAVDSAIEDAVLQVNRYWFELGRGQFESLRLDVLGLRTEPEISSLQDAIAALAGVKVTRHAGTAVNEGAANVSYELTLDGSPDEVLEQVTKIQWPVAEKTARLVRVASVVFRAAYD